MGYRHSTIVFRNAMRSGRQTIPRDSESFAVVKTFGAVHVESLDWITGDSMNEFLWYGLYTTARNIGLSFFAPSSVVVGLLQQTQRSNSSRTPILTQVSVYLCAHASTLLPAFNMDDIIIYGSSSTIKLYRTTVEILKIQLGNNKPLEIAFGGHRYMNFLFNLHGFVEKCP